MKPSLPIPYFLESIESHFSNQYKKVRENIALVAYSIIRCQHISTGQIARQMSEVNGLGFKANDMKVYRLLQSKNFQVDDRLWRGYIRLFFKLLKDYSFEKKQHFFINVDYTTDTNDFLILCASMQFQGQSIPLYFSMRKHPKRDFIYSQSKLETAFFKALHHILPKGYLYIIVAHCTFGNEQIIELLESLDFKYVLRLNDQLNMHITDASVMTSKHGISLVKYAEGDKNWILATNSLKELPPLENIYEERFSMKKMFKNKISGGFDLEKLQIKKYDRFKKLLFIACIAYAQMIFEGIDFKAQE